MGVSIAPGVWERLKDLRESYETLAREADELRRLADEGEVTTEDCDRIERRARDAYEAWQQIRADGIEERTGDPDEEVEEVPRDI